jgi:hypothetical protein
MKVNVNKRRACYNLALISEILLQHLLKQVLARSLVADVHISAVITDEGKQRYSSPEESAIFFF